MSSKKLKKYIKLRNDIIEGNFNDTENKQQQINDCDVKIILNSKYFKSKFYNKQMGLKLSNYESAKHYLTEGYKLNNNPSKYFNTCLYYINNKDVKAANINPLLHYEIYGKNEGRNIIGNEYKELKIKRLVFRKIGQLLNLHKIIKNKNCKILVVLHLYYSDSFIEIKEYLKNLNCYNYELIITHVKEFSDDFINQIKQVKENVKFVMTDNKGYDIGPFCEVINKTTLKEYDIVIKLQSKSTSKVIFIYNQLFNKRSWFLNLFEGVIGSFSVHKTIDILYSKNKYGLVAAKNLIVTDPLHKQNMVKEKASSERLIYVENYKFVAGSCFAMKAKTLKYIQEKNIRLKDFELTNRGFFSYAHFIERLICYSVLHQKYEMYGIKCNYFKNKKLERKYKKLSGMRLINDKRFKLAEDFIYMALETGFVKNYKLKIIELKELKRLWFDGSVLTLEECQPYKYLNGDTEIYKEYEKYHYDNNLPLMNSTRFDKLIKKIDKEGFNDYYAIVVNRDNIILDGQHRTCYLLKKYGNNYRIKVLEIDIVNVTPNNIDDYLN